MARALCTLGAALAASAVLAPAAGAAEAAGALVRAADLRGVGAPERHRACSGSPRRRPRSTIPVAAGEEQLRNLKWVGWGTAKATATGKRRYCSGGRCQAFKAARVELSSLATRRCHPPSEGESTHPLSRRVYTRYRLATSGKWLRTPLADQRLDCRQLP